MAVIAVVDDIPANRELLATILKALGHRVIEAADGAAALEIVRSEAPDLVICDILMPTLDGYEFVRQLRAEPAIADTRVVFYTAYYLEEEAQQLAKACGVIDILGKPSDPEEVIRVVTRALGVPHEKPGSGLPQPEFDRQHLQLMTGKLAEQVAELQIARDKLEALIELNLQLASQTDLEQLLSHVCSNARLLLAAETGTVVARATDSEVIAYAVHCGIPPEVASALGPLDLQAGIPGEVYRAKRVVRRVSTESVGVPGLPDAYPRLRSFLVAPLTSLTKVYGWVCLGNREGADGFSDEDEKLLRILAAQVGRIYENGSLYRQATEHARLLEAEIAERERAQRHLRVQYAVARILGDAVSFNEVALQVLQAIGAELDFSAGALWTVDEAGRALRCLDAWCRPPVQCGAWTENVRRLILEPGRGLSGRAWASRKPVWCEDIRPEPGCRWSEDTVRAALKSGGAFPIVVRGEVAGVIEVFGRDGAAFEVPLIETLASLGRQIGQFLERNAQQQRIRRLTRVYAVLSGINSTIVRVHDRESLFQEACRIAVQAGEFGIAWIGEVDAETAQILPAAWAGIDDRFAREFRLSVEDGGARSLVAQAVSERAPVFINDIASMGDEIVHLPGAVERGHRSKIALPLFTENDVVAVLVLYALEPDFFAGEELQLLRELAGDVSFALEYIAKKDRLAFLAYHDMLTGLPNRAHLHEHLTQAIARARQHAGEMVGVVVWNIHRFRHINETFGRQIGDLVLREIGQRFLDNWPNPMDFARIGVDHFAGIIHDRREAIDLAHLIEQIVADVLGRPIAVEQQELRIAASAGVAVFGNAGEDAETLLGNAEAALRKARGSGLNYLFYGPEMNARVAETLMLENRLRQAMERDEFVLYYQPKVSGTNGHVTGLEALMRWNDPETGLVQPDRFIPVLEETGMILQIGLWAIRQALADSRHWRSAGIEAPRIAVNVSAIQLQQENFVDSVRAALEEADGDSALVDLEITESMIMTELEENIARLDEIRRLGGDIAIDDFGTGYSSLGYLAKLPVSALKIDKSFIETMNQSPESMTIVSTIISLAHSLDLKVIAEGVEEEEQAKFLRLFKCNELQGYLISRPLPPDQVVDFLRERAQGGVLH
ncbi:EAL domain-containing protein [Aromatoleum sp.]|uniref:EAL domain-containing protein n=1 Tax=Aromatoleum sp. TaxID=2307007 RepID=UPI002FC7E9B9